jgi:hypothetical protein
MFSLTMFVWARDMQEIMRFLGLFNQFFPGYMINPPGALLGLVYGFLAAFIGSWTYATLRNALVKNYISIIRRRAEIGLLLKFGYFPDAQSRNFLDPNS